MGSREEAERTVDDSLSDIQTLRTRARQQIEEGPITESYGADRDRVIRVLNEALATELVCVLRYKRHFFMAQGINAAKRGDRVPPTRHR